MPSTCLPGRLKWAEKALRAHKIKYMERPKEWVASMEKRLGVNGVDERVLSCAQECKHLCVTGVLTLDEDNRFIYFCDQCALHP